MRILFLTDNFPPEGNAPATRTYEHAQEWIKSGHEVTVITCAPNFPDGIVFQGYKNRLYQKSNMDGIHVVRVKTYITANEGFSKRIMDYISFMISGTIAALFQKRPDIVIATSPQFFTAVAGWIVSVFKHRPFVFELRDIWPASITAVGAMEESWATKFLEKLELFLYRRADLIVSVTHAFKQELIKRGIDEKKIGVVLNGVVQTQYFPTDKKDPELVAKYELANKFVVGYVGTHGMAHGLNKILDAAQFLDNRQDIVFVFAGGGAAKEVLMRDAKSRRLANVVFIDRQPKEMMPRIWSLCDVSLVHLKNSPLFETVIPSKIFESMGMGIPILIAMPEGEATDIVRRTDSGLVVEPENTKALVEAIVQLHAPGLHARYRKNSLAAAPEFSRDKQAEKMMDYLSHLQSRD